MFSVKQKQEIAEKIEKILLDLNHPEMPEERPVFTLKVNGKEHWSFAVIVSNWIFNKENPPSVNPWNEAQDKRVGE